MNNEHGKVPHMKSYDGTVQSDQRKGQLHRPESDDAVIEPQPGASQPAPTPGASTTPDDTVGYMERLDGAHYKKRPQAQEASPLQSYTLHDEDQKLLDHKAHDGGRESDQTSTQYRWQDPMTTFAHVHSAQPKSTPPVGTPAVSRDVIGYMEPPGVRHKKARCRAELPPLWDTIHSEHFKQPVEKDCGAKVKNQKKFNDLGSLEPEDALTHRQPGPKQLTAPPGASMATQDMSSFIQPHLGLRHRMFRDHGQWPFGHDSISQESCTVLNVRKTARRMLNRRTNHDLVLQESEETFTHLQHQKTQIGPTNGASAMPHDMIGYMERPGGISYYKRVPHVYNSRALSVSQAPPPYELESAIKEAGLYAGRQIEAPHDEARKESFRLSYLIKRASKTDASLSLTQSTRSSSQSTEREK